METGKRFIGMFHTEEELMVKVKELKIEGYKDHQIFILAKSEDTVKMLQSRTDAEIQTTEESWLDKFMDFMTGEDRVLSLMDELGFSEDERAGFYQEVNTGSILLYVDEHDDFTGGQHQEVGASNERRKPALGEKALDADTWVGPPGDGVTRTPEEQPFGKPTPQHAEAIDHSTIERSEFSVAADDTITNGLEITDLAGEMGQDSEEEQRRREFQESVNRRSELSDE